MGQTSTRGLVWFCTSKFIRDLPGYCDANGRAKTKKLDWRTGEVGDANFRI